ncbi:hypothetical protein BBP00_00006092 [Phytophthora kernoviae]|uniref:STAS domain-containing protein n=1 Tax=Phytophthora kernoviae TaxID=325452 RepID=A0A3F2RM25_9STRA|nr:hypothetical protein BBP00_00006092 [Phytophthora kernoviae]
MVSMTSFTSGNNQKAVIDSPSQALLGSAGVLPTTCKHDGLTSAHQLAKLTNALLYGVINSIRTIPTMYGYALIIFSHPAFTDYTPALSKLVVFSSAVHQVIFTLLSSLPFAIGQVQDAGLIFLSTMATSICNSLGEDVSTEAKVATTVVTIGIATASLGVCLVVMGRLKLAAFASYLPMPVIGGYLAFIGLFCLYAGLALCTGHVVNDFTSMLKVLDNAHNVLLCLPGVVGGALLLLVSQQFRSPFALSTAIVVMPLFFFLVLAIGSISLDEARDDGWVDPIAESASISELINLFDFSLVHWDQVPKQIVTWIGMVFIVAFSSSLDVVAIEIDMGSKLRINHELETVGWSNVVSGLLGGYTGSKIFSQTIFTCRYKTKARIVDVCVILSELAIVTVPVSVMSYVPRFFLAATLIFVALDLMLEWLVLAYHKMSLRECVVVWLSFLAINLISLDVGMLVGMGIAILNFLLGYVQESVVSNCPRSSATVRDLAKHRTLTRKRGVIVHFEFCGNLFFGSSVQILESVQKAVYVRKSQEQSPITEGKWTETPHDSNVLCAAASNEVDIAVECLDGSPAPDANAPPTEFVVMNFSRVSGMDSTAARSAFLILQKYCKNQGITVVFADACPNIRRLLLKNGIADEENFFVDAEAALEFCENQVLARTSSPTSAGRRLSHHNEALNQLLHHLMGESVDTPFVHNVDEFFHQCEVPLGHTFYLVGEPADHFYLLSSGRVAFGVTGGDKNAEFDATSSVVSGSLFGEVSFFSRQSRQVIAIAMEDCTVFKMTRAQFVLLSEFSPLFALRLYDFQRQVLAIKRASTASGSVDEDLHDRIRFACLLQEEIAKALTRVPADAANSLIKRKLCKDFEAISTQLETAVLRVSAREQEAQKALVEQQQDGRIVAEHQGQVFEFAELENEIAHNEALIEEREQDINKIHQSVAQVNEIFRDLAAIVQDQQGAIDDIETHVHESMQQTQQGLEQVKQASDAQSYCVLQ